MDQSNLILGTFKFKVHATLPGANPNLPASYTLADFGEVLNGVLKFGGSVKEAWDSISGVIGLLKAIKTKRDISLEGDLQKIDPAIVMPYLMGAASGGAPAPGKITDVFAYLAIQGEGEPVSGAGAAIFSWYAVPCGIWVDGDLKANGEDYSTLKLNARLYLGRSPGLYTASGRPVV